MTKSLLTPLKNSWILLRSISVISSSVTTIVSTTLPIVLYYSVPNNKLLLVFLLLVFGGFLIHGVLTHMLNDFADHDSGTDQKSPAILSGGSRVIQNGVISSGTLWKLGKWLTMSLSLMVLGLVIFSYYKIALLLAIGIWGGRFILASSITAQLSSLYRRVAVNVPFCADTWNCKPLADTGIDS